MKVYFYDGERARSGLNRNSGMIYTARRNKTMTLLRRHVKPSRVTDHQIAAGIKFKAAVELWKLVSDEFKEDLRVYASLYNNQHHEEGKTKVSGYNIFMKAVCKSSEPFIGLTNLEMTLGSTLIEWIENDVIPRVNTTYVFEAEV
jgi:hypothetical protein